MAKTIKKFGFLVNFDASRNGAIYENYSYMFRLFPENYEPVLIFLKRNHADKLMSDIINAKEFVSSNSSLNSITIYSVNEIKKTDELEFLVLNYNFHAYFGGKIDPTVNLAYCLCSYMSKNKKIFIRQGDSSFSVKDHFKEASYNSNQNEKFKLSNIEELKILNDYGAINYNNVRWLLNGNRDIKHWGPLSIKSEFCPDDKYFLYIKDDILFNVSISIEKFKKYKKEIKLKNGKMVHIGYFSGPAVYKKDLLKKILLNSKVEVDIYGNSLEDFHIDNKNISVFSVLNREKFFETMSNYTFYFTVGKKGMNYTNKTLYDAMVVGTASLIYLPTDKNKSILKNNEFYFSDVNEILDKYEYFTKNYDKILKEQKDILFTTMSKKEKIHQEEL